MYHAGVRVGRTVPAFRKISRHGEKQSGGGGGGGDTETPRHGNGSGSSAAAFPCLAFGGFRSI